MARLPHRLLPSSGQKARLGPNLCRLHLALTFPLWFHRAVLSSSPLPRWMLPAACLVLALGMTGHPGSYEILSGYSIDLTGEVSRPTYQAMVARQIAMGHLGRRDSRAVLWLTNKLRDTNPDPEFTFRALKGARLARELRGQAAAAVALSGSERARNTLLQLRSERRARTTRTATGLSIASLDAALEDLDQIREYEPERALALPFPTTTPRNPSAR